MQPPAETLEIASPTARLTWRQLVVEPTESTAVQFIRYVFVGGFAFLLDFGTLYLLTSRAGVHYLLSAALAFLVGLAANYLLSRAWVFPRRLLRNASIEFAVFAVIGLVGLGLNELGIWLLSSIVGMHYLVSKMCTTAVVFFWNFTARKLSLFR
jgi:putative flippase GtrA